MLGCHVICVVVTATALTNLDTPTINKLLTALNECTEWGQVFILDSLAGYEVETYTHTHVLSLFLSRSLSHSPYSLSLPPYSLSTNSLRMIGRLRVSVNG